MQISFFWQMLRRERCNVSIDELKILLTAQQLCSPTNDQLYSLNAARVDFVPYQFRPALKMIHSERPRILVADSVGVGKTIEAGLILRELQARNDDFESVLIICPKPLVAEHKWCSEMKRFDENLQNWMVLRSGRQSTNAIKTESGRLLSEKRSCHIL